MQEIVLKIRYFERQLSKSLKKVHFIFLFELIPFNKQNYEKQKGSETSDQSLIRFVTIQIPLLVTYYLT